MMERSQFIKKIEAVRNLPTLPVIAMTVNKMLQNYESSIDELTRLLEKDQSLVMKILRLVNSSFFGFRSRVSSVKNAITLMGFNTIQNAVVTVTVMDALKLEKELKGFNIQSFWEHSIQVAVISKFIATRTKLISAEDAFTAGLLHDIGKVILANFFPDYFNRIIETMEEEKTSFSEAEKINELPSHTVTGGIIAGKWMLPEIIVAGIKGHHGKASGQGKSQSSMVVSVCNTIAHMMAGDANYELALSEYDMEIKTALANLFSKDTNWILDIKSEMIKACSFFQKG